MDEKEQLERTILEQKLTIGQLLIENARLKLSQMDARKQPEESKVKAVK